MSKISKIDNKKISKYFFIKLMNRTYNILLLGSPNVGIKSYINTYNFKVIDNNYKFLLWDRKCPIGMNGIMIFFDYNNIKSLLTAIEIYKKNNSNIFPNLLCGNKGDFLSDKQKKVFRHVIYPYNYIDLNLNTMEYPFYFFLKKNIISNNNIFLL